jgi:hypothetical protein
MEDLKKDVKAVKTELDSELKKINGVNSKLEQNITLIESIRDEQKHATLAQKVELDAMEACVKQCQISIGQHDERLKAYEANSIRQNGILNTLDGKIDGVGDDIHNIVTKVDAFSLSMTSKFAETERTAIARESTRDAHLLTALASVDEKTLAALERADEKTLAAKERADEKVETLRVEVLHDKIRFNWKIIGAFASFAFLCILVFISYSFHVFGGLP